jgi:hypothetical protein
LLLSFQSYSLHQKRVYLVLFLPFVWSSLILVLMITRKESSIKQKVLKEKSNWTPARLACFKILFLSNWKRSALICQ